jgi:hypothetical protein
LVLLVAINRKLPHVPMSNCHDGREGNSSQTVASPRPIQKVICSNFVRRSSLIRHQKIQELKDLPALKDTSSQKRDVSLVTAVQPNSNSHLDFCAGTISPKVRSMLSVI